MKIGIDMGGTFTDLVAYDEQSGTITLDKVPTPQDNPWKPITEYLQKACGQAELDDIRHGTTVGVNALLETEKGRTTALLTTKGFGDILEIGRQKRPRLYDLRTKRRPPLIPRDMRLEIEERMGPDGKTIKELDLKELKRVSDKFKQIGVRSIAILFLHSYINESHESRAAEFLAKEMPGVFLTPSSEVISQYREYERLSTTAINAYLKPVMVDYLVKLFEKIEDMAIEAPFYISQSDGGITSARTAVSLPVRTLYSGPSAGVVGCAALYGGQNPDIISLDMGGTSTDLALISSNKPVTTTEKIVAGYPVLFPAIDIRAVGAGGGSIAGMDEGGFLQVGPQSAKAYPGPACYGKGGKRPTITDANLILGALGAKSMLGGGMSLDKNEARQAIEKYVSKYLKEPATGSAQAIVRLAVSNIADSIRKISILKGIHPQDLKLVAYGGSGPMHAADIARELGIGTVIIPSSPGVFSAVGLLAANLTMDFVKTVKGLSLDEIRASALKFADKAALFFKDEKIPKAKQGMHWSADLRYVGQNYEINIPLSKNPETGMDMEALSKIFHQKHAQIYGHSQDREVEAVNLRLKCKGRLSASFEKKSGQSEKKEGPKKSRQVYFMGASKPVETKIMGRGRALEAKYLTGPAIIEGLDSTIVITPRDEAAIEENGDIFIKVGTG